MNSQNMLHSRIEWAGLSAGDGLSGASWLAVKITNHSAQPWESTGRNPVMLSYHWLDEDWRMVVFDGLRSALPLGGVDPGGTRDGWVRVHCPQPPGKYRLVLTVVREGVCWFDLAEPTFQPLIREVAVLGGPSEPPLGAPQGMSEAGRVRMTVTCRDTDRIPKVPNAGEVELFDGCRVQIMHEGSRVVAGGYHGEWMMEIIRDLRGHHEPQEEWVFHQLLQRVRPNSLMVELGCFWAYYTNWFLGAVQGSRAICVEPDANSLRCGEANLALNQRSARFINACVGGSFLEAHVLARESDGQTVEVPQWDFSKVLEVAAGTPIEVLHLDVQGAELPFLESMHGRVEPGQVRFIVISTHHACISGSPNTHRDCLGALERLGAVVLCEHSGEESFSGDGMIVASLAPQDAEVPFEPISRNLPEASLFGAQLDGARA
jgi:FkbM family methyltransferase